MCFFFFNSCRDCIAVGGDMLGLDQCDVSCGQNECFDCKDVPHGDAQINPCGECKNPADFYGGIAA